MNLKRFYSQLSPSYFTGRPAYFDTLNILQKLAGTVHFPSILPSLSDSAEAEAVNPVPNPSFKPMDKISLERKWRFKISNEEYILMARYLTAASWMAPSPKISSLLQEFKAEDDAVNTFEERLEIDEFGRAYAVGQRRKLLVHTWLVNVSHPLPDSKSSPIPTTASTTPNSQFTLDSMEHSSPTAKDSSSPLKYKDDGHVYINGIHMNKILTRWRDRMRICIPFEVTGTIGRYNVWCKVEKLQDDIGMNGYFPTS